jgi:hypothetical protein
VCSVPAPCTVHCTVQKDVHTYVPSLQRSGLSPYLDVEQSAKCQASASSLLPLSLSSVLRWTYNPRLAMDTRPQRPHLFQPNRSPPSAPLSPASTTASSPSVAVVAVPVQGAIPSSVSSVRSLAPAHVRVPLPSPVAASRGVTGILSKPKPTQPPQQTISRVCPGRWDGANMGSEYRKVSATSGSPHPHLRPWTRRRPQLSAIVLPGQRAGATAHVRRHILCRGCFLTVVPEWCEETYVPAEGCTRCMYCEEFMRWG